ncbi:MAG: glycosyltransferase [Candidatus Dormibacterales bacterium]
MRIAVTASLVTPLLPAQAGGAQAFVADLARGLAGRGHEVRLYCAQGSRVEGVDLVPIPVDASVAHALVMPGGPPRPPVPALREGFGRLFDAVRADGPEAVSQHAFDEEAFHLAAGLPVLHTLHLPPLSPPVVAAARASGAPLATVSEAARRLWRGAGLEARVLRDGVPDFEAGEGPVSPCALIAGRISPEKGTAAAVRVARGAGLKPLVVGSVYDEGYHRRQVLPLLEGEGPLGPLPRPRLWRLMSASAVTLMPVEWEEPFGLVAAESQLAGCPVAAYRRGGLPEVVQEGVGGILVEPGDEAALVRAARACLDLDRARVRESARRLLLGPSLDAYELALGQVAAS